MTVFCDKASAIAANAAKLRKKMYQLLPWILLSGPLWVEKEAWKQPFNVYAWLMGAALCTADVVILANARLRKGRGEEEAALQQPHFRQHNL